VRLRRSFALVTGLSLVLMMQGGVGRSAPQAPGASDRSQRVAEMTLPDGFLPAAVRARQLGRYFVEMKTDSVADVVRRAGQSGAGGVTVAEQRRAAGAALAAQGSAIAQARSQGGQIIFRYKVLVNAFSARLTANAAAALAQRADVQSVQPVSIVQKSLSSSVPFIGAPQVWSTFGVRGQGMQVAIVDTGIDYTHASFGGAGTVEAYQANDPTFIENGSFPTEKVIGGYDFVGENYDVLDADSTNDVPHPDFDPLDEDGHGTHTGSTVAGIEVPGQVGSGVAPEAELYAFKVWDVGNSTDDVLVAAYERAVDPNQDGNVSDAVDVVSFSGGVSYGTLNSLEARAAQRVVDLGTVFVASAGNEGNQAANGSAYIVGTPATARGVVAVAASIDEFLALVLAVNSTTAPPAPTLPDGGQTVHQSWSAALPSGGWTDDLFDGRAVDPNLAAQFCSPSPLAPGSLTGQTVLVRRGTCAGSQKTFNAQNAGAAAVIIINNVPGAPVALGSGGEAVTIPAFMISQADGAALLAEISPGAPATFNTVTVNATIGDVPQPVPGFEDALTGFTSEGPARLTHDLKPDISAPGLSIAAAAVGTGNKSIQFSGTSMAAPHVSGVATLLRQLHPTWSPAQIKAVMMNQAQVNMKNADKTAPAPATAMGAGRVQAFESATAASVAWPGSLSFGFAPTPTAWSAVRTFQVKNFSTKQHGYTVSAADRYSDFDPAVTAVAFSLNGTSFSASQSFTLKKNKTQQVWVRLTVDPDPISEAEQQFGWYYFHPNMDGTVTIAQSGKPTDVLRLPWHVAPRATSDNGLSESSLDLTGGGSDTMELTEGAAAGISYADLYLLGATDAVENRNEADIVAVGARSFTGSTIGDAAEGVPSGTDATFGLTWQEFLTSDNDPTEPVEIGVQTWAAHNTTETLEVDVFIDAGADGLFADPALQADYLAVKLPGAGGEVCVFDLSLPDPFAACAALYFADYSNYNSNLVGLVLDAKAIGLTTTEPEFSYHVEACTGTFTGDVPGFICDSAGEIDGNTWNLRLNAADPALAIDPLVCQGFWDGGACDGGDPIDVSAGSTVAPGDNPSILALFPNDAPDSTPTVVETTT
jgi:minor extracellular serine protease Vpr